MKKVLLLLWSFLFSLTMWAIPVDKQKAQQTAQQFMQSKGMLKGSTPKMVYRAPKKAQQAEESCYYVFNAGNDNGFVIVSGDDRIPAILGYSDTGYFDMDNLPENARAWMNEYAAQIRFLDEHQLSAPKRAPRKVNEPVKRAIAPMITSNWNQSSPYNNTCPLDGTSRSVTGCVATAMAQVLYYHRANSVSQTQAEIPAYTTRTKAISVDAIPAGQPIEWNNMCDKYSGSETTAQKTAVANLMLYCGASVEMDYKSTSSGAYSTDVPDALIQVFGYDENTQQRSRSGYSIDEWDNLLYSELLANRPVYYSGQSTGGGHAFVIDGFDGDELFHVNWGWGGSSNGYFLISVLNPGDNSGIGASSTTDGYSMSQGAVFGAQPSGLENPSSRSTKIRAGFNSYSSSTAYYQFWNGTGTTNVFKFGIAVKDNKGDFVVLTYYTTGNLSNGYGYSNLSFSISADDFNAYGLQPGTYRVYPVSCLSDEENWEACLDITSSYLEIVYDGTAITCRSTTITDVLNADDFVFSGSCNANDEQPVEVKVTNTGNIDFSGTLYLFASKTTTKGTYQSYTGTAIRKNGDVKLGLTFTPTSTGTYNVWIATNSTGTNVIGQGTVEIGSGNSTNSSGLSATLNSMSTSGSSLYGNEVKGTVTLSNTSDQPFIGSVDVRIFRDNHNGYYLRINRKTVFLNLEEGESATIDFDFGDLEYGEKHFVSTNYYSSGTRISQLGSVFTPTRGVTAYKSDGTKTTAVATSSVKVASDVVAVDFTGVTTVKTITPNDNPNTLYIMSENVTVPSGINGKNIVKGTAAENIVITDGYDFYAPVAFTVENISYTRTMTKGATASGGWETITLPFDVTKVTVAADNKELDWFRSNTDEDKDFWLKEFSELRNNKLYFDFAQKMEANIPYVIAVPGASYGEQKNLVGKELKFIGENVSVEKNATPQLTSSMFKFVGTYIQKNLDEPYVMNEDGTAFEPSSVLAKPAFGHTAKHAAASGNMLPAFRAAFIAKTEDAKTVTSLPIGELGGVLTAITELETAEQGFVDVYSINGMKVKSARVKDGQVDFGHLPRGIYIVAGKKVVVQ